MNVCTPDNCICDAVEWPGDTNCFGVVVGEDQLVADEARTWTRRLYYKDKQHGLVFSVDDPSAAEFGRQEFYEDPELTVRAT